MAYIPDDAIEDAPSLSAPAWLLYCNLCRRRNHKTGRVIFSFDRTKAIMGTSRASLYRALNELITKGWVIRDTPWQLIPNYGNFTPVNKRFELSQDWDKPSHIGDRKSQKMRHAYKEEPALSLPDIYPSGKKRAQKAIKAEEDVQELPIEYACDTCKDSGIFDRDPNNHHYVANRYLVCNCSMGDEYVARMEQVAADRGIQLPQLVRASDVLEQLS